MLKDTNLKQSMHEVLLALLIAAKETFRPFVYYYWHYPRLHWKS